MNILFVDRWPLWAVLLGIMAIVLASLIIGFRLGLLRRKTAKGEPDGPVGAVMGAVLGLLAFMLAFTFSITANRFDTRKQLLLDEVNALGTAALRAQLLPEPHQAECRALLKRYVDLRVEVAAHPDRFAAGVQQAEAIQDELWTHAMALARADMNSDIGALFVESLNEVFDLHTSRVTVGTKYRIPPIIWYVLDALIVLGMVGVGYQFGLSGRASWAADLIIAVSFALVLGLIVELDRSTSGLLKVSQKPMLELQQKLMSQ